MAKYLAGLDTPAGDLLMRVLDFDAALQLRMHITLDDVLAEEFWGLKVLQYERNVKQTEDMERERQQAEMKHRMAAGGMRRPHANPVFSNQNNPGPRD